MSFDYGWNGSAMTFGGANVVPLTDLRHHDDPSQFKTTGSADTDHYTGAGLPRHSFTASFLGSKVPNPGAVGSVTIAIAGYAGESDSYAQSFPSQINVNGTKDGRIEGNMTIVPGATSLSTQSFSQGSLADYGFNGSVFTFNGHAATGLLSCGYSGTVATIECAGAGDADNVYRPGIPDETITVTCLGGPQFGTIKTKGASIMAWNDGGVIGTFALCELVSQRDGGMIDGQSTTEYTFKPCRSSNSNS
jgi:hypothetical protein